MSWNIVHCIDDHAYKFLMDTLLCLQESRLTAIFLVSVLLVDRAGLRSCGAQLVGCLRGPSILFIIVHKEEKNCKCKVAILNLSKFAVVTVNFVT